MGKFGIKEVMDVTFYSIEEGPNNGLPVLFLDTLKMSNIENTAEESSARGGRGNPELIVWDFNREATMTLQDALISPKSFELLSGNAVSTSPQNITMRQTYQWQRDSDTGEWSEKQRIPSNLLIPNESKIIKIPFNPANATFGAGSGTDNANKIKVYLASDDGGTPFIAGIGSPDGTTGEVDVTLSAGPDVWDQPVVAYYRYASLDEEAEYYLITSDSFPGTYRLVGDTVVRNTNGDDEPFQVVIERAKVQPGFSMNFQAEGDPSAFDMNIKILRDEKDNAMVKMIKY